MLPVARRPPPASAFGPAGRSSLTEVEKHADPSLGKYPSRLSFYTDPPRTEVTLTDFETYALDRLKILKAIENAQVRNKGAEETNKIIKTISDKYLPLHANSAKRAFTPAVLIQERQKDHISHFILRLAYCRTEDNRAWLLKQETALFKHRFETEEFAEREAFLLRQKLDAVIITAEERREVSAELAAIHPQAELDKPFYKVPFEQVLSLVGRRAIIVRKGFAYVPEKEQAVLVTNAFKEHLQAALVATARALPRMDEDDRLIPVLNSIARQCASRDYGSTLSGAANGVIQAAEIDALSSQGHFPLCMSNLQTHLKADGHLKHVGRLQFGLFLKGIGVPLEEALFYWRKAFYKITDDKFQKEYAYNIRYNYGQEGSRKDYAPYSCLKIITSNHPSAGDHHGCPFRHAGPDQLRAMMVKSGAPESSVGEVLRMAKEGHYQVACTRLFEITRGPALKEARRAAAAAAASKPIGSTAADAGGAVGGGASDTAAMAVNDASAGLLITADGIIDTIEHPNQWFDLSYRGSKNARSKGMNRGGAGGSGAGSSGDPMDLDR
ncbi:hypothetical protein HDV05_007116 [Chytridiales sp. JEL 0842]|nr:hypothetical protein HDV05_007116 [Chytridiales sp. JEL 0842]